jgi:spermidine/putrescine-binding protein
MKGAAVLVAAPTIIASARAQSRELLVFAWYPIPVQAIIKDFAAETKTDVKFIGSYSGNPVWWSKMIAGEAWDVFLPSMDWMTRAALADRLEPLDLNRLTNLKNLSSTGRRVVDEELSVNGKPYGLPWALTINSLAYNTKLVDVSRAKGSWDVMWDPAYSGRLTTKDEAVIPILTAASRLGFDTGDLGKWTPEQFEAVRASLLEQKKLVRKYWSNHEEVAEMLLTEQVVAGVWSDGRARLLAMKGHPIASAVPPQGAPAVIDAISIPKNAPNKDIAYEFLDFVLRPEQMIKISKLHGATVLNDPANALLPEGERALFAVDPAWKLLWRRFATPELSQRIERVWTAVRLARG